MDGLNQAINRAESFEREQKDKAKEFAKQGEPEAGKVASIDPLEAAANMAESLLKVAEKTVQAFIDNRLLLDKVEIEQGRESLAPVIEKYNLAAGNGKLPYAEEISAGLYLGGLWRRFRKALGALRAYDKAEKEKRERDSGNQREYQPEKPAHPVSGEERVRQEPDANQERWNTESWGAGSALGQQQGSSGTPV